MKFDSILPLACGVQNYPWGCRQQGGKRPYIADLLGVEADEDTPFAELWIGAHEKMPARVVSDPAAPVSLDELIAREPEAILGKSLAAQTGNQLPFLLKVLSCEKPLSIQAHPDRTLAARLHERDPEHYPDANHKPEIAVALTEFDAFCQFRPAEAIRTDLQRHSALRDFFGDLLQAFSPANRRQWLKDAYAHLFAADQIEIEAVLEVLQRELADLAHQTESDRWFLKTLDLFPGDRGTLSAYFLNAVHLRPGQAVFLGPNEPHAYLNGTIVECMASSDNVVRAGLTPKFIDRDVLVEMLTYKDGAPHIISGVSTGPGQTLYRVPAEEFELQVWRPERDQVMSLDSDGSVSILLVTSGQADVQTPQGRVVLSRGSIWLWPAALASLQVTGRGGQTEIFRARPSLGLGGALNQPIVASPEEDMDFGAMLEAHLAGAGTSVSSGDKVRGVISAIDDKTVFVDINAKSEGILERHELLNEAGELTVKVGDPIEAFCLGSHQGEIRLGLKLDSGAADASLAEAFEARMPVEGRVTKERKGGFEVSVGNHSAFCPFSQMDIHHRDAAAYVGERFTFLISEYGEDGRNLVLSRRRLLEEQRRQLVDELKETLQVGDLRRATIRKIMPFGVFADIGGIEGLIPMGELAWGHVEKAEDIVAEGDNVEVMIRDLDWERERVSLSLKRAAGDPWTKVEENYYAGGRYTGTVTRLMPFGAFVELEPGLEGLVHISKLGAGRRINHPSEVLSQGDVVEVALERIDLEQRRLSLTMESTAGRGAGEEFAGQLAGAGSAVTGTVENVQDFGVFVTLPDGRTGLLHVSQIELTGSTNQRRAMFDRFKPGSEVTVVVKDVQGDRISLTLPESLERESEQVDLESFRKGRGSADLGSLGDLFGGLDGLDLK